MTTTAPTPARASTETATDQAALRFGSLGGDRPVRAGWALFALAVGGFAIGTTEFASMGLLPQIAAGVGVSIPTGGHLVSAYALGVVVGAPLIAAFAARMGRRRLLLLLMAVFALGNAASAVASSFGFLLVARFVSGLPHGAYFGVASLVAAALVAPDRRASAVARVMLGLTISNIVGVPVATLAGQHLGWPALYVAVAVLAVACLVSVLAFVPPVRVGPAGATASVRGELSALARPQVWFALVTGMVSFGGMFATYSYIAPTVETLAGLTEGGVVWILAMFGVGSTVGTLLGGRLADRALIPTLFGGLAGIGVVLALFGVLATTPVGAFVAVFLLGASGSLMLPALQTRLMDVAAGGQSLAAALNHATLNIANALGAWLGGAVLAAGHSYAWPSRVSVVLPVLGILVLATGLAVQRRSQTPSA
ncbi:MFS transporter [Microlunatus flavus]|uniref:MFS transporter, DHA1 family, inner membrane transport protein n=1 Tax=Microlunatus flavus TaxID=1036181 RepID=A0A1H9K7R6_9ACTN|nr:MFS transporter [Microlunatus flavus]SEQ95159.1 MFS transporter, DHA1 family, inner membrane transport protein [Microlunatus flavus]